jgi:hypothetical protein
MNSNVASLFGRAYATPIVPVRPSTPRSAPRSKSDRLAAQATNFAAMVTSGAGFSPPPASATAATTGGALTEAQRVAARSFVVMSQLRPTPALTLAHLGPAPGPARDLTPMAPRHAAALTQLVAAKLRYAPHSEIAALEAKVATARREGV